MSLAFPHLVQVAQNCDNSYFTQANFDLINTEPEITDLAVGPVALIIALYGDWSMGINAATNPDSAKKFYSEDINGARFLLLDVPSMTDLGFTDGSASGFVRGRNDFYGYYR